MNTMEMKMRNALLTLLATSVMALAGCSSGGGGGGGNGNGGGTHDGGGNGGDGGMNHGDGGMNCHPGERSCPCGDNNTCNSGLTCDRGFCVDAHAGDGGPNCTPGALNCGCNDGNTCNDGLVCLEAKCQTPPPPGTGLSVTDAAARGCDVLFEEIGGPVDKVTFANGVTGQFARRDGHAAVSFVAGGMGAAATIQLHGGVTAGAQTLRYLKSTCYDQNGKALQGDGVHWD
jgi:hypothetical protein